MQFVTDVCKRPVQSLKSIWAIYSVQLVSSHNKFSAGFSNRESGNCLKMKQAPQADAANAKSLFSRANARKTCTEKYQSTLLPSVSKSQETKSLPKSRDGESSLLFSDRPESIVHIDNLFCIGRLQRQ